MAALIQTTIRLQLGIEILLYQQFHILARVLEDVIFHAAYRYAAVSLLPLILIVGQVFQVQNCTCLTGNHQLGGAAVDEQILLTLLQDVIN